MEETWAGPTERGARGEEEKGEAGGEPSVAAAATMAVGAAGKRRRCGKAAGEGGAAPKKARSRCPHDRERSKCKECGGASLCQHQRRRTQCKECREETSMSNSLEELEEAGV